MKPSKTPAPIRISAFAQSVIDLVKRIPRGKVATYGQIAALAGKPHGARGVGWILHACANSHRLPWQRVLNSQGRISFSPKTKEYKEQKRLLEKEGVVFLDRSKLSLEDYQWKRFVKPKRGGPRMFS